MPQHLSLNFAEATSIVQFNASDSFVELTMPITLRVLLEQSIQFFERSFNRRRASSEIDFLSVARFSTKYRAGRNE